jgi:hypothetical protein
VPRVGRRFDVALPKGTLSVRQQARHRPGVVFEIAEVPQDEVV